MDKPNIIFILPDQHNGNILGCAGDNYVRTPNIDMLAQKGTLFNSCYCNSPLCVPSRSSMLSGRLPSQNGVYNNMQTLSSTDTTFVHSLTAAGYETVLAGRMHFIGYDQRHGFKQRLVGDLTPSHPGTDNEYDVYGDLMRTSNQSLISLQKSGWGDSAVLHYDHDVMQAACGFLEAHQADRPLFMTIGFYGPHCPYIAQRSLYEYYYNLLPTVEYQPDEYQNMHPAMQNWFKQRNLVGHYDRDELRRIRAAYYSLVETIDNCVGKILDTINRTIGFENTIIVYSSDHGDNIGDHGLFWKTNFYEGSVKVPLIFRWDGHITAGVKQNAPVSLVDIAPTFIDFADGIPLPDAFGISLVKSLQSNMPLVDNRAIISQLADIKGDAPSAMIRKGEYKLIAHCGFPCCQLFNMKGDPNEKTDLGNNPAYNDLVKELLDILFQYWNPDDELLKLEHALQNFKIMKQWAAAVSPEPYEEWRGNPSENYVHAAL